ncbi:MAG: hypothetical protein JRI79_02545 [Deltaproteobacteria bacterium]|nr:hypothetical protein [Deltaproteobacteria bacterium]MBW2300039.1 hypothetical protein [Deltaproteobacteria bacterium]
MVTEMRGNIEEKTTNAICIVVAILAILVALFLLINPMNCISWSGTSLISIVSCLGAS